MGLFSGSTKTYVYASTTALCEINENAISDAVVYAILNESNITSKIINTLLNGMASKMNAMRQYAKSYYTLGLPTTTLSELSVFNDDTVADAIADNIGAAYGVSVTFNTVTPLSVLHAVFPHLITVRGWNPTEGTISNLPSAISLPKKYGSHTIFYKVYITNLELNDAQTAVSITYSIKGYYTKITRTYGSREAYYDYSTQVYLDTTYTETVTIPADLSFGHIYCIASYNKFTSDGSLDSKTYWWFYDISLKTYSNLVLSNDLEEANNLYPVIPLRYKNASLVDEDHQSTDLYLTSKKVLKKLNLDIDDIGTVLESNDNIDDIDNAYIMFGINLQTDNDACIEYLLEYFDYLADLSAGSFADNLSEIISHTAGSVSLSPQKVLKIGNSSYVASGSSTSTDYSDNDISTSVLSSSSESDISLEEYGLNISISYTYIRSDIISGSIGEIGTVTKSWTAGEATSSDFGSSTTSTDDSILVLQKQINTNVYKQVTVKGLIHYNYVTGSKSVVTSLYDVITDSDENNFILPLHAGVISTFPISKRNQVCEASAQIVLNSIVTVETKWYQSGIFRAIIMIVGIIITVYTGQAWVMGLTAAATAGTVAVLIYLFQTIIIALAVSTALDYVSETVGPKLAALVGIIIACVGFLKVSPGSFSLGNQTITTSDACLKIGTALTKSAATEANSEIQDIQQESESFTKQAEEQEELLEEAQDSLEIDGIDSLDLLSALSESQMLIQPLRLEEPETFYNLLIHTGNIGTTVLKIPTAYCETALTLPKAGQTLGLIG